MAVMADTDIAHPSGRPISPGGDQGIEPAVNNQPSETDTGTDNQAEEHDVLLDKTARDKKKLYFGGLISRFLNFATSS